MFEIKDNESERIFLIKNDELSHMNLLEERIIDFLKNDKREVVLDFQHLMHFDSVALASLIRIKRKMDTLDRPFRLINYNQTVLRVIELSGLEDFLLG
ncbi:MAG TPA: STAS domain-containing protein [Spirochaetota bacterium]|nr:STAS domain-containing protein [Spirochaetota bacterium]HPJ36475.1 STAS domain-containing protein [Spirochaetota bacterium]